jgi:hypothetical protein
MYQVFLYLHVLSAILMGVYLMFPFLSSRIQRLTGAAQFGFVSVLFAANRAGQLALIISFLTGGYLVGKSGFSVAWMIASVVLFLALGALTGVLGSALRKALADPSGASISAHAGKITTLSIVCGCIFFVIVTIMMFPF